MRKSKKYDKINENNNKYNKKRMKLSKKLFLGFSIFILFINMVYANTTDNEEKKEEKTNNIVQDAMDKRKEELNKVLEKSQEEKDLEYVQWLLHEVEIKKEVDNILLSDIKEELYSIQKRISANDTQLKLYEELDLKNQEINTEVVTLKTENQKLKKEAYFKESLINDLKDTIDSYKILEAKYNNLLENYVSVKKKSDNQKLANINTKLKIFYAGFIFFLITYILKLSLQNHEKISRNFSENFFAYYDFIYWLSLSLFIIIYLFFVFPQFYILFVFVSWSIIVANVVLISSFVSSIIIFRKFSIGDIIKMEDDVWKIVKITPIHTIIKKINEHGMIEKDEISIPNINLIKDKVTVIKDIKEKDHIFYIILSLRNQKNIFDILTDIRKNIILKHLTEKPKSVNKNDEDMFKSKYEQIDSEHIRVNFYWIATDEINRKIEQEIINYLRINIIDTEDKEIEKKWKIKTKINKKEKEDNSQTIKDPLIVQRMETMLLDEKIEN